MDRARQFALLVMLCVIGAGVVVFSGRPSAVPRPCHDATDVRCDACESRSIPGVFPTGWSAKTAPDAKMHRPLFAPPPTPAAVSAIIQRLPQIDAADVNGLQDQDVPAPDLIDPNGDADNSDDALLRRLPPSRLPVGLGERTLVSNDVPTRLPSVASDSKMAAIATDDLAKPVALPLVEPLFAPDGPENPELNAACNGDAGHAGPAESDSNSAVTELPDGEDQANAAIAMQAALSPTEDREVAAQSDTSVAVPSATKQHSSPDADFPAKPIPPVAPPHRLPSPDVSPNTTGSSSRDQGKLPAAVTRLPPSNWVPIAIPLQPTVVPTSDRVMSGPDLAALCGQVKAIMAHAENLAGRGALFTAQSELVQALRAVAQTLDAFEAGRAHGESLALALRAMREAADFTPAGASIDTMLDIQKIVDGHRTPALKDENLDTMTGLVAQQRYLAYAQRQLAAACGRIPAASRVLHALGRMQAEMGRAAVTAVSLYPPKAMTYYQAALLVDADNYQAANELGVLLARCGRAADARNVLAHAAKPGGDPVVWHNLAVVYQQLGDTARAQQATQQWRQELSQRSDPAGAHQSVDVRWVDPRQFMAARPALGM